MGDLPPVRAKGRTLGYASGPSSSSPNPDGLDSGGGGHMESKAISHYATTSSLAVPFRPKMHPNPHTAPSHSSLGASIDEFSSGDYHRSSNNMYNTSNSKTSSNSSSVGSSPSGWTDTDGNFHPFVHTAILTQEQSQARYSKEREREGFEEYDDRERMTGYPSLSLSGSSNKIAKQAAPPIISPNKVYVARGGTALQHLFQADYIVTRIQKVVRGRQCRTFLWRFGGKLYVHQVMKIQKVFRRFWSNKYKFMPIYVKWIHRMANKVKNVYYLWLYKQKKRLSRAKFVGRMVLYIQAMYRGREDRKRFRKMRAAMRLAAIIRIQRYTRGHFGRKRRAFLAFQMGQVWESMKMIAQYDLRISQSAGSGLKLQDLYQRPFEDPIEAMHVALTFLLLIDRPTISMDVMTSIFWSILEKIPTLKKVYQCILFSCWAAFGKTNDKKTEFLARALYLKFAEAERYRHFPDNIANVNETDAFLHDDLSSCTSIDTRFPWFKPNINKTLSFKDMSELIEVLYFQNVLMRMKNAYRIRFLVTSWALTTFDLYLFNTITVDHSAISKETRDRPGSNSTKKNKSPDNQEGDDASLASGANITRPVTAENNPSATSTRPGTAGDFADDLSLGSGSKVSASSAYAFSGFDYSLMGRKHAILSERYREWCENVCNNTSKMSLNNIKMTHQLILSENVFGKFHKILYKKLGRKYLDLKVVDYLKFEALKAFMEIDGKEKHVDVSEMRKAINTIDVVAIVMNFVVIQCGDCLIVRLFPHDVEINLTNRKWKKIKKQMKYVDIRDLISDKWKETVIYPLFLTAIEVKFIYELAVVHFMKLLRMEYADIIKRTRSKNIGEYLELVTRLVSTVNVRKIIKEEEEGAANNIGADDAFDASNAYLDDDTIGSDGSLQENAIPIPPTLTPEATMRNKIRKEEEEKIEKSDKRMGGKDDKSLASMGSLGSSIGLDVLDSEEEEAREDAKPVAQKVAENAAIVQELRDASLIEVHFRTVIPFIEYKRVEINEKNIYLHNILSIQRVFRGFLGRSKCKRVRRRKHDLFRQLERTKDDLVVLAKVKKMRYLMSSKIQAAMRGFLWRKRLAFLHAMAHIVQNNTRIYLSKLELARRIRRREFGPDLILVLKKSVAIDISMSSRHGSVTGYNSVQSIGTAPTTALSYINMKTNEAVMSISLACVVWRCGNNYKMTANNYITNETYEGFVYWEQLAGIIQDYNILATEEQSRSSKYNLSNSDIDDYSIQSSQSLKEKSLPSSKNNSIPSSRNNSMPSSKNNSKPNTPGGSLVASNTPMIQDKNGNKYQMMKMSMASDDASASSASSSGKVQPLKIYHYERIAELLLTKIEINPIAYQVLVDFKKYHGSNPKAALAVRNSNEYNTYGSLVEKINYPGLSKFFSSQSTVTLAGNNEMQQQLNPALMKSSKHITTGFVDKQIWDSIAPIYSHNPNIIGSANIRDQTNFYQYKTDSRLLRDQKSIAEKYFRYLRSKSQNIIITAGDQSVRHTTVDKSKTTSSKNSKSSKGRNKSPERAKTPDKKTPAIGGATTGKTDMF